jgi:hypothetical protein
MQHIIPSVIGSGLAEILTLPICTVKTNYQNTQNVPMLTITRQIWNAEGMRGFWRASLPAISSQILSSSSKWTIYKLLEEQEFQYSNKFINGASSGMVTSIITHPIDVVKINLQMRNKTKLRDLKFYKGYSKSFSKATVGSFCFFPFYEYIKCLIPNPIVSSAISAVVSTTLLHPIDYLKNRHVYQQTSSTLYQDGWKLHKYYKGLSLNLLRVVPHFTIWMSATDFLKGYM